MDSRRDFIKKASLLAGGAGLWQTLPSSIQKAIAINPDPGTTFEDASHVVLLMQENRSFDHCFGTLQGVRGFNDPRAIHLPDKNLVWLQSNAKGETYTPFRLDITDTRATWMSSLPHSWTSQVDARNEGRHDHWLEAKRSGNKQYADMPLTLGYYNREDLPFYYALADAFTVCDQHFCSSLTGTTPNRLYYWTGTIREHQNGDSPANVDNSDVDYDSPANWTTFPEKLEARGVSWKVYQNELSVGVGFKGEQDSWLGNFTDNPLEWFSQYHVRYLPAHTRYLQQHADKLALEIKSLEKEATPSAEKALGKKRQELSDLKASILKFSRENFQHLPRREQNLHGKGFTTNVADPSYHELTELDYRDGDVDRQMQLPRGDVLYQFRKDVQEGTLPTVSWLVAPENFSDHPGAPWYGAWYVSEVLDILTQNPEVWKKTIFILTYDENDGYFDHIPPFVAPDPTDPRTGKCSAGIDTTVDYVTREQASALKGKPKDPERVSPVGLGYRVPFVVASPWSRGGWVNSQVFDNTSVLMFLEKFLAKKPGKAIREDNISPWRRAVCGDLTSIFRPYNGEEIKLPPFVRKKPFLERIYNARFKDLPADYKIVSPAAQKALNENPGSSPLMPAQENGIRHACALPYQLYAEGKPGGDKKSFLLKLKAADEHFGKEAAGAPFTVYDMKTFAIRNYAVTAGDSLTDLWEIPDGEKGAYHFRVYGPNGFFREFREDASNPGLVIRCEYERKLSAGKKASGNVEVHLKNTEGGPPCQVEITDNAYGMAPVLQPMPAGATVTVPMHLEKSFGWYDFTVRIRGSKHFTRRYAGRVETGNASFTDPAMARVAT
ncbi:MAG TPA: phospholipase C, phosphocholine-specific [Chitinophagaceae bacterium]|nr:phospholipase C, phosphocholine-specific [Chitinophagaceae bacterium]